MRKSTKLLKRLAALLLLVLMSINSFAAIVGDNDGAAFITKAEFESLKSEFSSQIDRYNNSLDNKIDGKIATYLAGLRVSKTINKRSSLEVAGQLYNGTARKSYVFAGNDSNEFISRYATDANQFHRNYRDGWNMLPNLYFRIVCDAWTRCWYNTNLLRSFCGSDEFLIDLTYAYKLTDDAGNEYSTGQPVIFIVDDKNYVSEFKIDAEMEGRIYRVGMSTVNTANIQAMPFMADATHRWVLNFKDVVGASGTNGMGYSTRQLGDNNAFDLSGYRYRFGVNEGTSLSGATYMNRTINSRGNTTYYIFNSGTSSEPQSFTRNDIGSNATQSKWFDPHLLFDETRFGSSYAWCMPFGHLVTDRTVACFSKWPAWDSVIWKEFNTESVNNLIDADARLYDTTGNFAWRQSGKQTWLLYHNGLSRTFFDANNIDFGEYLDITGMLPVWSENPLKDWRLLKNRNIKNALSIDAYYSAAPPLTDEFSEPGTFTWVAKISQEDVQRIPGRTWDNWGTNRIYFTNGPMDDIEYSGTDVTVSNTKKFMYKKHDTSDAYADCQSQVIGGKTYYYQTLDHDTYYDFKMEVDSKETVYYMIFDESHPSNYCLEVIEHPDYQIEFIED